MGSSDLTVRWELRTRTGIVNSIGGADWQAPSDWTKTRLPEANDSPDMRMTYTMNSIHRS